MNRVYADLAVLWAGPAAGGVLDRDAVRALDLLRDAGHEVLLVAEPSSVPDAVSAGGAAIVGGAPLRPDSPAWYLTADVERCRGRSAHLRTVLVGVRPAEGAIHRCDMMARDARAAVLEILAAEAMPVDAG